MTATALPTPTPVSRAGTTAVTPTAMDDVNGNTFLNSGKTWLDLTNTDSSTHTVNIHLAALVDGQSATPRVVTLAAGITKKYTDLPVSAYGSTVLLTVDSALVKAATYNAA